MIKVAICDDESAIVKQIRDYVQEFEKLSIVDVFDRGESLIKDQKKYDVIFLDIDLRGLNGIKTAKKIRAYDKKAKIIYVTSYEEYRNYAFSVHAFAYLVKPVCKEAIHKQLKEVLAYMSEEKQEPMLRFVTEEGIRELGVKDIYYFEYMNRKIQMKTKAGVLYMHGSITSMAEKMEPYGFYMPHKSFTVNLFYVKAIRGYDIFMTEGSVIPLSQKKSADFRERLSHYMANLI